jgi:outer membrane protein assembly factor BamA
VKKQHIFFLFGLLIFLGSCSYTKHVPEGQRLLWDQDIVENEDQKPEPGAESILKQVPNQKVLWTMPKVAIYNWGNGNDSNFFSKIGEAPVIFDSVKTKRSAEQLRFFYFNKGYFGASSRYEVKFHEDKRWASVTYYVTPGERFYINSFEVEAETKDLKDLSNNFAGEGLIHEGDPYDADVLDKERGRLADVFKNEGYYNFSKAFITFQADTTVGGYGVDVLMTIGQKPVREGDSVRLQDHERYRFNEIYIQPDYDYETRKAPSDTLNFRGYEVAYDTLRYKPRYLTDAVHFKTGDLYRQRDVRETYAHLVGYQAFEITEIKVEEAGRDSLGRPMLNSIIHLNPLPKMTLTPQPEVTTSNGYLGVNFSLGFVNRNIFKGGESFEFKVNAGIDYQATVGSNAASQAVELGAEASINFPRFLLPFNTVGLLPKRMRPRSKISLFANRTARFEFDRETFGGKISYIWNETMYKTWTVDLYDVSFSKLYEINETFRSNLNNFQLLSFRSEFIPLTRVTFVYNGQLDEKKQHHQYFKAGLEVAGTSVRIAKSFAPESSNTDGASDSVAGVLYYQYFRPEADYRFYWNFTESFSWVNRAYAGFIQPYGNSSIQIGDRDVLLPPFSKFFFMGGSNDLRAWPAYRLGAGTQSNTDYSDGRDTSFAVGNIKLLINSEFRFPIYGYFEGALFVDAGNIWLTGGLESTSPGSSFNLDQFYKQLAVGTGFGLRLNLDYFVLRGDIGVKVRDPGLIGRGDPWVIGNGALMPKNWTVNIALGYPF